MSEDLVTVADFLTKQEANMARGFLESNGFEVFLADEAIFQLTPVIGVIKLRVREEDAGTVRELLADVEAQPVPVQLEMEKAFPLKLMERTHEEATEAIHTRREGHHPEAPLAREGAHIEVMR